MEYISTLKNFVLNQIKMGKIVHTVLCSFLSYPLSMIKMTKARGMLEPEAQRDTLQNLWVRAVFMTL